MNSFADIANFIAELRYELNLRDITMKGVPSTELLIQVMLHKQITPRDVANSIAAIKTGGKK